MFDCPICSHELLPHISHGQICWFCHYCWQDFPNLEEVSVEQPPKAVILKDPTKGYCGTIPKSDDSAMNWVVDPVLKLIEV
ncbi:hypothetical protein [Acaryochloris marina]|uniref:hypothetical protein n=1 Tax=Acaryochloris marina TaxID=155978 RepID=UPI0021C3915D|nr:hypothetical protein [Acaryochloris marina]